MTIQEIEAFFAENEVPVVTILNRGTKIVEPAKFLEVNIMTVKEWQNDLNKCPSYWHLCELVKIISGENSLKLPTSVKPE